MRINSIAEEDYCLLEVAGSLSADTVHLLRTHINNALAHENHMLLDFSELDFVDSTAVGLLVQAYNACVGRRKEFIIINPGKAVMRLFSIISFDEHITVFSSRNDAIRYVMHTDED